MVQEIEDLRLIDVIPAKTGFRHIDANTCGTRICHPRENGVPALPSSLRNRINVTTSPAR